MTKEEFSKAVIHQLKVLSTIQCILKESKMSLGCTGRSIYLNDNGRDIGYTGFHLEGDTCAGCCEL